MKVTEIFKSIQGESTYLGLPCSFVRLSGCNLRCSYCDTAYAYGEGEELEVKEILARIKELGLKLVEITGGEPLLQKDTPLLAGELLKEGYKVLVETNGSLNINFLPAGTIRIMDIKCPGSTMAKKMDWTNIKKLKNKDEVKFVLKDEADYQWAKEIINKYKLIDKVDSCLLAPAFGKLALENLAKWILRDELPVRLGMQLQKYIWGPGRRGV